MQVSWRSTTRCLPRPKGVQNKSSSIKHRGFHTGTWYRYSNTCCYVLYLVWASISFSMKFLWSCYSFWYHEVCISFLRALCSFFRPWCLSSCIVLWRIQMCYSVETPMARRHPPGCCIRTWSRRFGRQPNLWIGRPRTGFARACRKQSREVPSKVFDSWGFGAYLMCKNLVWRVL